MFGLQDVNWNLIKCAFNKHDYGKPIRNDTLDRLVKICIHCQNHIILNEDYKFKKLQEKKAEIINAINEDSFCHAKSLLDDLLKGWGY